MRQLLLILAALVTYGSLYPFGVSTDDANWAEFLKFLTDWSVRTSRGDFIANILLFAPIGFIGVLAHQADGRGRVPLALTVVIALTLAFGLQLAQLWVPGRSPELGDAIINAIGLVLGIGVASAFHQASSSRSATDHAPLLAAPLLLALLWVGYRWYPLIPTLDLQNVKNGLKPLLLSPILDLTRVLTNTAGWLVWMLILHRCQIPRIGRLAIAGAAVAVLMLQLLFVGNTLSLNNVTGLGIALILLPALRHPKAVVGVILLLLTSLLAVGLYPYRFVPWANVFEWLPFAGFLEGSMESNAVSLIYKCYFYGSALYLMHLNGTRWRTAALTLAVWLALIEAGQVHVIGRTAEITDPLLALILGYAMSRLHPKNPRATCVTG